MNTLAFNPSNWYWRSDNGRVYSSAAGAVVPKDDAIYAAWLDNGGVPTVWPRDNDGSQTQAALDAVLADLKPKPPALTITRAQAKIQLRRAGLRATVEEEIAKADDDVQDWYAEAGEWQRTNAHVVDIGAKLGLTDEQIDDLFRAAALIDA